MRVKTNYKCPYYEMQISGEAERCRVYGETAGGVQPFGLKTSRKLVPEPALRRKLLPVTQWPEDSLPNVLSTASSTELGAAVVAQRSLLASSGLVFLDVIMRWFSGMLCYDAGGLSAQSSC